MSFAIAAPLTPASESVWATASNTAGLVRLGFEIASSRVNVSGSLDAISPSRAESDSLRTAVDLTRAAGSRAARASIAWSLNPTTAAIRTEGEASLSAKSLSRDSSVSRRTAMERTLASALEVAISAKTFWSVILSSAATRTSEDGSRRAMSASIASSVSLLEAALRTDSAGSFIANSINTPCSG